MRKILIVLLTIVLLTGLSIDVMGITPPPPGCFPWVYVGAYESYHSPQPDGEWRLCAYNPWPCPRSIYISYSADYYGRTVWYESDVLHVPANYYSWKCTSWHSTPLSVWHTHTKARIYFTWCCGLEYPYNLNETYLDEQ